MSIAWQAPVDVSAGRTAPGGHVAAVPWDDSYALFLSDPNGGIYGIKATPGFGWENVPGLTSRPGAPITALAKGSQFITVLEASQFVLFLADAHGEVFTTTGAPYGGWSGWVSVSEGSTVPGGHVAAVPWGDSHALFLSDPNGGIYGIKATPGFGWENVPGLTSTPGAPITALARGSQFVLFVADAHGEVFTTTGAPYAGWSGWVSVSEGSTVPGGHVAAVPWGDSYALFLSDPNGGIYGIKAIPGFGWENVPGLTSIPGAPITALSWFPPSISNPNADSPILLFATNANGEVVSTSGLPYQPWQPWSIVGNRAARSGAMLTVASKLVGIPPFSMFFADPAGEVFATTSVVLKGSDNAVLMDNCQSLSNLTVQLQVTEDLVTLDDLGFSLQLNSYPQIGAITPNSTQATTKPGRILGQLYWLQYLVIVAGNKISFEIQYWVDAQSYRTAGPGNMPPEIRWPPGYTPDPPNTSPWLPVFPGVSVSGDIVGSTSSNKVPAGSVITIHLATDSIGGVTGATFSITDSGGKVHSASTQPWQHYAGKTEPSNYALFPIYGFQADLVCPPGNKTCTFTSGAGTLTYSVSPGVLSVQTSNKCGGAQPGTFEDSNVVYQEGVWPVSGWTVRQSLAVLPQG